jgi:starch synthase
MRVAFLVSEAVPYAKTGGLADVAGALPRFLARQGVEVRMFMPFYREVRRKGLPLRRLVNGMSIGPGKGGPAFSLLEHQADGFAVTFIDRASYFDRDHLYGTPAGDDPDNGERFAFFSRASLEAMKALDFAPNIVHGHDWQSATAFAYLRFVYGNDPFFASSRSLFTVHNLAYQGLFDRAILDRVGLPGSLYDPAALEFYGKVNFLKSGFLYADAISTVSPTYSREIQTPEYGCGLDGLLRMRSRDLHGILNGVDYLEWNPVTDPFLPARFGPRDLSGKRTCRAELLRMFGMPDTPGAPVVGMVTRLAAQKGLDIACEALDDILALGAKLVILGAGDRSIEDFLGRARALRPDGLGLKIAFDERVAHMIYAGSDIFLIPSRYEPCGLTQMYALKYGTIPVVRATGGLDDTIQEVDPAARTGNGFKFPSPTPADLVAGLRRALEQFADKETWRPLVRNAMASDFSWTRSAGAYLALYRKMLKSPRP